MYISDIKKYSWEKGEEWPNKWYDLELCFSTFAKEANPLTKLLGIERLNVITLNKRWFYDEKSSDLWSKREKYAASNHTILSKLNSKSKSYLDKVKMIIAKVEKSSTMSEKILGEIRKGFIVLWYVFNSDIGKYLGYVLDESLVKRGFDNDDIEQIKDFCLNFEKPLDFQLEEENLERIKFIYVKKNKGKNKRLDDISPLIKSLLTDHWEKFRHLTSYDIDTNYFTVEDFFQKVRTPIFKKRILKKDLSPRIKSILGKDDLKFVRLIKDHIFLDNYASDLDAKLNFLLAEGFSKRFDVSPKELSWYSFGELERLVINGVKLSDKQLKKRKKYRVMIQMDNELSVYYGRNNFGKIKKLMNKKSIGRITHLKGYAACRGLIKGKVKIVNGANDIGKVLAGDILVATNTSPDLIMAIKRCVGIITDYGGITSHAAIISREFNIPCIVGTDIATQVLKDGNLVELDANNGVIKILDS